MCMLLFLIFYFIEPLSWEPQKFCTMPKYSSLLNNCGFLFFNNSDDNNSKIYLLCNYKLSGLVQSGLHA